jgi:hypothetical protein
MWIDHALSSFSTQRTKFQSPSTSSLNAYKTMIGDIETITPLERRFLDHTEDLITVRNDHNEPQTISDKNWPLSSKAATLILLLIIPLSLRELHWVFIFAGVSILIIVNR